MSLKISIREQKYDRTVLIDADLLLYSVSDPVIYQVKHGLINEFRYKKEAVQFCEENKLDKSIITKRKGEPEEIQNVLHTVKLMIQRICDDCQANPRIFLSNDFNFRYDIYPEYKANRKDTPKPFHYMNIKQYLLKNWKAEVAPHGMEADDIIAQLGKDSEMIMASIDKDFQTVPGLHYKWRGHYEGNIYRVTEEDAEAFLCYQLLAGDSADNIISPVKPRDKNGVLLKSGFGSAKARDFLLKYEYSEMREAVHALYREQGFGKEYFINLQLLGIGRAEV